MQTIFFLYKCNIVLSTVNKKVKNKKQRGKEAKSKFDTLTFTSPATSLVILFFFLSRFFIAVQPFNSLTLPLSKNNDNASGVVSLKVYYFNLYLYFLFLGTVNWIY